MQDIFADNEVGSASKATEALEELRLQGQKALNDLELVQQEVLLRFERGLTDINSKRLQALNLLNVDTAAKFLPIQFTYIDQANTSATVRIDSSAATLKEKSRSTYVPVRDIKFRSTAGVVEQFGDLYRVHNTSSPPTGVFEIELQSPTQLSLIVFDTVISPSKPDVVVSVSQNGIRYTRAQQAAKNGYRINSWLSPSTCKYIRIEVTPTHPDSLSGDSYTFGLTDLHVYSVEFYLASEYTTTSVPMPVKTGKVRFVSHVQDPGLSYFLSFNGQQYTQVQSGDVLAVPGVTVVEDQLMTASSDYWLRKDGAIFQFPVDLMMHTLRCSSVSGGDPLEVVRHENYQELSYYSGTVNVDSDTNHTLRWVTGDKFSTLVPGRKILLDGQPKIIKAVLSDEAMTVFNPPAPKAGVPYVVGDYGGRRFLCFNNSNRRASIHPLPPLGTGDPPGFLVSYLAGPSIEVALKVKLFTTDKSKTPVFTGAHLEYVYE